MRIACSSTLVMDFWWGVPGLDLRLVKEQYLRNSVYTLYEESLAPVKLKFQKDENIPSSYTVGTEPIMGLPKLLVLASLFTWNRRPNYGGADNYEEQRSQVKLPGDKTMTAEANYLISVEELTKGLPSRTWKLPTPPYVPPCIFAMDPLTGYVNGSFGGVLVPNN